MSIHNVDEFKIKQNGKNYSVIIGIEEDQLSWILILYTNPPKKYSGFFSLNELRISSKIFNHTKTLFEAKEIIKRTVIKKQLQIDENELRANITFDTGLGHNSVPFPISLFRDATPAQINNVPLNNTENPRYNIKKTKMNKNGNNNIINNNNVNNIINYNNINNNKNQENNYDNKSSNTNNKTLLKASIGNNVNNKMLNQTQNVNNNTQIDNISIGNIQFNNSRKRGNQGGNRVNTEIDNVVNNDKNSHKNVLNNNPNSYKKIDFENNVNNNVNGNKAKDYVEINNNLLQNIYNKMNNNNNINSSFYRNLKDSFIQNKDNINANLNNNMNNNNLQDNLNMQNNINKNNIPNKNLLQYKQMQQHHNNQKTNNINPNLDNNLMNPAIVANNQSFVTAPLQRNLLKMPNVDKNLFLNQSINFENIKNKTVINNENRKLSTSSSEEEDNNDSIEEENNEESYQGEQPYRFKNLILKGPKKIKGNLAKFKENQNIGDYVPCGTKYVSYLKFPDTKNIANQSMTASTISSSLTSGSNRIVGIEKNIIKNPSELEEISVKIQRILRKRNIRYKLLYKASVDGDISSKFHEKCDHIPNTLILIKASLDKRFGGFTTQTWDGDNINKNDDNCFIFSIDKGKIYDINEGQEAINCNPDLGPIFINQIKLLDKFFIQGGSTNKKGKTFSTLEDFEITGGVEKFAVKEVEVYQVK